MKRINKNRGLNELLKTDALYKLIDEMRVLPFSHRLQQLDPEDKLEEIDILAALHDSNSQARYIVLNWIDEQRQRINRNIADLPEGFQQYIWGNDLTTKDVVNQLDKELRRGGFYQEISEQLDLSEDVFVVWIEAVQATLKYERFYKLRQQFQFIIELAYRAHHKIADNNGVQQIKQAYSNKFANSLVYEINAKGMLTVATDEFSQAINGKKVTLIRVCRKCQTIFWGKNTQSQYCGAECRKSCNTYHADKSRRERKNKPELKKQKTIIKRRCTLTNLKSDFLNKELWSNEMILIRNQKPVSLPKETEIEITKISINEVIESMPFRFDVKSGTGMIGYLEVEFDNKLESKLKKIFWMDVGWKRKRNNPRGASRKT